MTLPALRQLRADLALLEFFLMKDGLFTVNIMGLKNVIVPEALQFFEV